MSDRPTPETDAATLNKWQDSCPLQVVPKSLAVALERQRDELLEALEMVEIYLVERGIETRGTIGRTLVLPRIRAAIAAVKGGPDACPECGTFEEPYFCRLEPMGYFCPDCGTEAR